MGHFRIADTFKGFDKWKERNFAIFMIFTTLFKAQNGLKIFAFQSTLKKVPKREYTAENGRLPFCNKFPP